MPCGLNTKCWWPSTRSVWYMPVKHWLALTGGTWTLRAKKHTDTLKSKYMYINMHIALLFSWLIFAKMQNICGLVTLIFHIVPNLLVSQFLLMEPSHGWSQMVERTDISHKQGPMRHPGGTFMSNHQHIGTTFTEGNVSEISKINQTLELW